MNNELAVLISVYCAFDTPRLPKGYPERLAACIKSLQINSNVTEKGYPIYVQLDDVGYDMCWGHLDGIGFPRENILRFKAPQTELTVRALAQHYYMFLDPTVSSYKRFIAWDVDLLVMKDESTEKLDMDMFLVDKITVNYFLPSPHMPYDHRSNMYHWRSYDESKVTLEEQYRRIKRNVNKVYPGLIEDDMLYHRIHATCTVYPKDDTQKGFKDFAIALTPIAGDDELILQLWVKHKGEDISDLYGQFNIMEFVHGYTEEKGRCFQNIESALKISKERPLLIHYKITKDEMNVVTEEIMDTFYRSVGLRGN